MSGSILSTIGAAQGVVSRVGAVASGVGNLARSVSNLAGGAGGSPGLNNLGPWASARLPASWRGVRFKVRETEIKRGRRQALHEYPFRDDVWVEDLGRATRITSFRGFLVGDDVDEQLKDLIVATEGDGEGTLVHPALGTITASIMDFTARDVAEQGRVWALEFVFISGVNRSYPMASADTQGQVATAGAAVTGATSTSFGRSVGTTLSQTFATARQGIANVQQVVRGVESTVGGYVRQAEGLVHSVTTLGGSVIGLAGNFGRFSLGARLASTGLTDVTRALSTANTATASVSRLGRSVAALASAL